jgi:hypothetical protein
VCLVLLVIFVPNPVGRAARRVHSFSLSRRHAERADGSWHTEHKGLKDHQEEHQEKIKVVSLFVRLAVCEAVGSSDPDCIRHRVDVE